MGLAHMTAILHVGKTRHPRTTSAMMAGREPLSARRALPHTTETDISPIP